MTSLLILILTLCLLLAALLAASEAALAATNRVRLRHLLQNGAPSEEPGTIPLLTSDLSSDVQRFIATVTIAASIPMLAAAALATLLAHRKFAESPGLAALVLILAPLLLAPLTQIAPRLLVAERGSPDRWLWVRPARVLVTILRPPVQLMLGLGSLLLRPFSPRPGRKAPAAAEESKLGNAEEIRDLVETAQASGALEAGGKELIESIFDFGDTRAHEVMIPRLDIVALALAADMDTICDALQHSGFSRLPVCEESIDSVAGILHAKDVLGALGAGRRQFSARELMRNALYVPESQRLDEALAQMRAARTHLAIVLDEYGGTAGLLTVEDILEELVGDIADEHDRHGDEPLQILDENTALADALLHRDDLRDAWDLALPGGEFDTIGGFMIEQLGRALEAGDRIELPSVALTVHSLRGKRAHKILIERTPGDGQT